MIHWFKEAVLDYHQFLIEKDIINKVVTVTTCEDGGTFITIEFPCDSEGDVHELYDEMDDYTILTNYYDTKAKLN